MFTDRYIRNLKPEETVKDIREKRGFGIRVKPDGVKTFFYRYTSPVTGARRFLTLGNYPKPLNLEDARIEYGKNFELVKSGIDPLEVKHHEQEERSKAPTVAMLVEEYIKKHAKPKKRSWQEDERILYKELLNEEKLKGAEEWTKRKVKSKFDWSNRKAADITKRDIVLLLENITDRGAPIMSNLTFAVIRKMFNYAVEKDILPHSPANGVKMPNEKKARERVLTEQEIKTLWRTLDTAGMTDEIKRVLKLILVTAQRPGEVVGIHTSEIDGHWWTIPSERSKNKIAHRVYLTDTALELIGSLKTIDKKTGKENAKGFIFPTPLTKKEQSIDEKALSRAIRNNLNVPLLDKKGKPLFLADGKKATENRLEVDHFTPHDLRRTAATFMAKSGEMNEVIDAIQNHAKQGIIKVYNQYKYEKEKQMALESWERKLNSIITGGKSNVVSIQTGKAINQ